MKSKRQANKLSALGVEKAKKPGRYSDGLGLYLFIVRPGEKVWTFRYMRNGRAREMSLGPLHSVSLLEARERARQARQVLLDGRDPIEARRDAEAANRLASRREMTFAQCTESFLSTNSMAWRNDRHRQQWRSTLQTYAYPIFGDLPVAGIDVALVVRALEPIWSSKAETANRLRGRIERVLAWAEAQGLRAGENPAAWSRLKYLLPLKARTKQHHAAMPFEELPAFMAELRARDYVSAKALEFCILTASRTSEAIGARWEELDLEAGLWTVPAARMKANRPHVVPLSERAVEILKSLPRASEFVFLNGGGKPLSNMAMLMLLKGMRPGLTVHGFRSAIKTWAREATSHDRETQEATLAHVVPDQTERAYIRGNNLLDKRARLMRDWARYCATTSDGGNVVDMQRVKRKGGGQRK